MADSLTYLKQAVYHEKTLKYIHKENMAHAFLMHVFEEI